MRRFVKPRANILRAIANSEAIMPFQYVNWWGYRKGMYTFIKDPMDMQNPLYIYAMLNLNEVVKDLADWYEIDISDTLFAKHGFGL